MRTYSLSFADRSDLPSMSKEFPRVARRTLTRVANSVKSFASEEIRKVYNIRKSDLDARIFRPRIDPEMLTATINVKGSRIPLIQFGAKQTRKGVSFMVRRGDRKKLQSAFIARMRSGHVGVFVRDSRKRLPIKEKFTIAAPEMFGTRAIIDKLDAFVKTKLPDEFDRQLRYYLASGGK